MSLNLIKLFLHRFAQTKCFVALCLLFANFFEFLWLLWRFLRFWYLWLRPMSNWNLIIFDPYPGISAGFTQHRLGITLSSVLHFWDWLHFHLDHWGRNLSNLLLVRCFCCLKAKLLSWISRTLQIKAVKGRKSGLIIRLLLLQPFFARFCLRWIQTR